MGVPGVHCEDWQRVGFSYGHAQENRFCDL